MPERSETYTLDDPITFEGVTYTQITLRTPKGRDLREMGEYVTEEDKAFAMMAKLSGLPIGVFDEMLQPDIEGLADCLKRINKRVPRTRPTSSGGSPTVTTFQPVKSTG
jgi:hypothetical protein